MTSYVVTVPLVQVATEPKGVAVQVAKDGILPDNVTKTALANLIDLGYVEKVKEAKAKPDTSGPNPGTAEYILNEVGDDKAKAQAALDEENAKEQPRKGLVADLEKILAG